MRKVIYSMGVSLDGYIADADGGFDWGAPDAELHSFHNEQARELGAHFLGRRLYEVMLYWETAEQNSDADEIELDFARIWLQLPKVVFSTSLKAVEGSYRLATEGIAAEVAKLKEQPGKDLGVGGAGLAASFAELGLIDEFRLFVYPVVVGGGTPFFPPLKEQLDLELVETRTFSSRVVFLRYRRV
jgi:dihydrofolate reductase